VYAGILRSPSFGLLIYVLLIRKNRLDTEMCPMNWSTCPRLQILWVWDVSRQFEHPTLSATGGQCHAQTVWNPGSFLVNICEMMFGICLTPEQTGIWSKHHLSFTLWVSKLRKDPRRHGFHRNVELKTWFCRDPLLEKQTPGYSSKRLLRLSVGVVFGA